jgi:hypothetical protein
VTRKQMYEQLARIAGKSCRCGEPFIRARALTPMEVLRAQNSILALMEKLNYERTHRDFRMGSRELIEPLREVDPGAQRRQYLYASEFNLADGLRRRQTAGETFIQINPLTNEDGSSNI